MHAVRSASSPGPDRIDIYMLERSVMVKLILQ